MEEKIINILKKCCEDFEDVMEYDGECMVEDGIIPARCVLPANFGNKEMIISLVKKVLEEKSK